MTFRADTLYIIYSVVVQIFCIFADWKFNSFINCSGLELAQVRQIGFKTSLDKLKTTKFHSFAIPLTS